MNPPHTWRWLFLAALLAGLVFAHHHFRKKDTGPIRVVPNLVPAAVSSVQIQLGPTILRAERTNDGWRLTQPLNFPAQKTRIEFLLHRLQQLTPATCIFASELKDRSKADEEYGFANPQVSILLQQGPDRFHLLLGARTAPGDQLFVQLIGVETVFVVDADLLKSVPRNPSDWRDTTLLNLNNLAFDRLSITNAGKLSVELQRADTNGLWQMVRPFPTRANSPKIAMSLEKLQTMRISQFVTDDPKPDLEPLGLQPPQLEIAFQQGTNLLSLLQFGKTNDAGEVYARRSGLGTIVTVANDLLAPWRAPVNDFRQPHLLSLPQLVDTIEIQADDTFSLHLQTNSAWRVDPQGFSADAALVRDLLLTLSGCPIEFVQDIVTESGLPTYGLATPARKYRFTARPDPTVPGASNNVLAELHFGSLQGNRVFVRRADENSVYAITTNDYARLPAAGWQLRERQVWNFAEDDLTGATIRKEGKTCQILRKQDKWSIAPGSQGLIKHDLAFQETLRGLLKLTAGGWVARGEQNRPHYGLSDGSLQITLELKTGEKVTVQFGGEASSAYVYAAVRIDGQDWIFQLPWPLFRDVLSYMPVPN